jgi:glycerophosphoryl diester phosphodiesterase
MKKLVTTVIVASSCISMPLFGQQSAEARLNAILNLHNNTVYVAAHRGDWRDAPENSILSLKWSAKLGVDIVEMDLKRTKDGQLVVMHDFAVTRTTTGTGLVADLTLAELKALKLRAGTGHPTVYTIPTFTEFLDAARDSNMILNVDQGWDYFADVVTQARASHALNEIIINVYADTSYPDLIKRVGDIPQDATIMVNIHMEKPGAESIIKSYEARKRVLIQCIWKDDQEPSVIHLAEYRRRQPIWVNSLWPEQNGGHDDDAAVDYSTPAKTWGWLIDHGVTLLQTDRPRDLVSYLQTKQKMH